MGSRLSLLRLPNTRHSGSGLYKVPLNLRELLHGEADEVLAAARRPRQCHYTDVSGLRPGQEVEPLPDAEDLFRKCVGALRTQPDEDLPPAEEFVNGGSLEGTFCAAEMGLYEQGVPEGHRTRTALRLASRMRAGGYGEDEAVRVMLGWNERNRPPEDAAGIRRAVRSAYSAVTPYSFGCGTGRGGPARDESDLRGLPLSGSQPMRSLCKVREGTKSSVTA